MPVVSDTSPILGLAAIHCIHLLRQQFERIEIPMAVFQELKTSTNFRGSGEIAQAIQEGWIIPVEVKNTQLVQALASDLDRGEAEAITLALQSGTTQILMDETDGRLRARSMGLRPIGVLGVLLRAKKNGQVNSLRHSMLALRSEVGFFISAELFEAILKKAGE